MRLVATLSVVCLLSLTANAAEKLQLQRPDGSTLHYSVDRPAGPAKGTLLLAQGSGCLPTDRNASFAVARAAFPDHVAIMVEKYGIGPGARIADGFVDCPPEFHAGHTVTQRVEDYQAVLAATDAPRPLILFGGSEGGLAVARLATRVTPDAVVILSSATGIPFTDMVLSTVPPEGQAQVKAGFAAAKADPEGTTLFAGSSHRFWADIMAHVPADYMVEANETPFLLIQGGLDTSSPVAAARSTADLFASRQLCNLTYWEFPALDHGMVDPSGTSRMADVTAAAARWATAPSAAC